MKPPRPSSKQLAALQDAIGLHNQRRLDEADAVYRKFLRDVPGHPDALHLRALVAHARGDYAEAAKLAEAAIAGASRVANFHNTAGDAWRLAGDPARAVKRLSEAVRLDPSLVMARRNLALALADAGQLDAAVAAAREAGAASDAAGRELVATLHVRRARQLLVDLRFEEAAAQAREAVAADPAFWGGWAVLGEASNERAACADAERQCAIAANLAPDNRDARLNLAHLLREQQRLDEAASHYEGWLREHPDDANARFGRAWVRLAQGDYAQAWPDYEHRWAVNGATRYAGAPQWEGQPTRRLLVYPEQGLGDFLQMLRFVPAAASRAGGDVTVQAPAPLLRLVRRNLPESVEVVEQVPATGFDHACPVMSLPLALGVDSATALAPRQPYLVAGGQRVDELRRGLAGLSGRKLGIVWRGAAGGSVNRRRALDEQALLPLLQLQGWTPVSLQFGVAHPTLAGQPLHDLAAGIRDFDDLAAAMQCMDAVVSLDTGPAHLAGALGVRCYTLLPLLHDWRWGTRGDRCDWYPDMTLVRQRQPGSWQAPIERLVAHLRDEPPPEPQEQPLPRGEIVEHDFPLVKLRCHAGTVVVPLLEPLVTRSLLAYGDFAPGEATALAELVRAGEPVLALAAGFEPLVLRLGLPAAGEGPCRLLLAAGDSAAAEVAACVARCRPVVYVRSPSAGVMEALEAAGYRLFGHEVPLFDAANPRGLGLDVFGGAVLRNVLALPGDEAPPAGAVALD